MACFSWRKSPLRFCALGLRRPVLALLALALVASGPIGCGSGGPAMAPVSGVVLLDGKPVEGAAVQFIPAEGRPADGITDSAGKFTLQTFEPGDGALLGAHRVTVTGVKMSGVKATADGLSDADPSKVKYDWFVPQKYSIAETSQLQVEVKRGMEPVKLELASR